MQVIDLTAPVSPEKVFQRADGRLWATIGTVEGLRLSRPATPVEARSWLWMKAKALIRRVMPWG